MVADRDPSLRIRLHIKPRLNEQASPQLLLSPNQPINFSRTPRNFQQTRKRVIYPQPRMAATHEFTPGSSDVIIPATSKANSISLDLGSRNKIVIHPPSKDIKQKSIFPPLRTQSIFKEAKECHSESPSVESASQSSVAVSKAEGKSAPIPLQQLPSPRLRGSSWGAKDVAKLAQVRRAMGRVDKEPIEKRSPRAVNPSSVMPVILMQRPEFQSPYAKEYVKCGCTKRGGNPCRRCQLMLLSDRFCDLVNFHCEKWNASN